MTIRILPSAVADLEYGRDFYESREVGLGDYFQDCLCSDIDSLVLYAGIHRRVFGFHRLLSKRFPYAIYYRIEADKEPVDYRILDCRRDPKRIRKALGQS
ncbi:MAG: type II toxin-antitoxin system RelE/ParE family toxin [Verrucomicrobia bacterium]|nr:type II toxin-antitoxin system RelE/ParE family toxin [Verrucomicrobiota bacterium]